MSELKRCTQCGILKEQDDFRKYTYSRQNGTEGRYRICKTCESINTQYAKLSRALSDLAHVTADPAMVTKMLENLKEIEALYDVLEARGLRTPRVKVIEPARSSNIVANIMSFYKETAKPVPTDPKVAKDDIPRDLLDWLDADEQTWLEAGLSPEYLQETIYESLKAKYRPQLGVDKETYMPIYDDTYKDVLNKILRRFDDYEEACQEDDNGQ